MAPLMMAKYYQKNVARTLSFGTNEGNLAIGLSAGVFSLIIGATFVRWCIYYRRVQREFRRYERRQAEQAELRAQLAGAYPLMVKVKYLRSATEQDSEVEFELKAEQINVEAGRLAQLGEDKRPKVMESPLSEAQMAPEVGVPLACDGQKQVGAGTPCASAHNLSGGDLDRPGALLYAEFSKEYGWDNATGSDGDDQGDETEPPSSHCNESTGPESTSTLEDETGEDKEGPRIPAICEQRINGPYRITNGNEANSVES